MWRIACMGSIWLAVGKAQHISVKVPPPYHIQTIHVNGLYETQGIVHFRPYVNKTLIMSPYGW
jgi:hypothetical protein